MLLLVVRGGLRPSAVVRWASGSAGVSLIILGWSSAHVCTPAQQAVMGEVGWS
jgi:hypothetical protein